jgi:TonB family protein
MPDHKIQRIRLGGRTASDNLLDKADPVYPPLARQARISGTVRLHAILATDGKVQQLEVLSGHPLLAPSALDAVRQWHYKPTLLNGEPVEVDTTIDVIYSLQEGSKLIALTPAPPQSNSIDAKLRADIARLLDSNQFEEKSTNVGRNLFESMRPMLTNSLPNTPNRDKIVDAYMEKLLTLFKSEEIKEGVIAAYAKYFTDEDILALTEFYKTPTGRKFNDVLPDLSGDLNKVGITLAQQKVPGFLKELCAEFPELGGKLPDCPAAGTDKKSQFFPSPAIRGNGLPLTHPGN